MAQRFRINSPDVIHETLDNEAIIIKMSTGCYYSLNPTGSVIWHDLEQGVSMDDMLAELARSYDADEQEIGAALRGLLAELQAEELIAPLESNGAAPVATAPTESNGAKKKFSYPKLQKYTDMTHLILTDPIHDVDLEGWPTSKA